jgi:penicillin amidase
LRLWGWIAAGLGALIIVLGCGLFLYLRSSLPATEGRIVLAGPTAPIRIARDADGVPRIIAANDADAAFGLGFVHAQDRLFQMELMRRLGAGRLAEIFGPRALAADRLTRTLGLYRAEQAAAAGLSPAVRRGFAAYAAGVNAYIARHPGALPPEFLLLRFRPEPWQIADSLVWGKLMGLELGGDYRGELLRARLARTISPTDLGVLFPEYPKDAVTTLSELRPIYRRLNLGRLYAALPGAVGPAGASNNWVVDGRHSASGKPLLANDPHLRFAAPGIWYLAQIETPQHKIAGATAPGVPLVVIGHNERIAWGMTTTGADIEDLYIEKLDPANPDRYATPDGSSQPFAMRQERIAVRGASSVEIRIRTTRHGPVLSDVLPAGPAKEGYVLALAATFLAPGDRTAEAVWNLDRAADWAGFKRALADFVGPPQNIVYGDAGGTIGFIAAGYIPIRRQGQGWLPEPGWTGAYDWTGTIPFDELPQAVDPPSGRFVSANNRIVPQSYRYFISRGWDLPNRAARITQLLERTPRQTPQASAAIMADTQSIMAQHLAPLMTAISPESADARQAIERLRRWDFHMDRDKVAPLLFTAWLREFSRSVLFGRFGNAISGYWDLRPRVVEAVLTRHPDWCAAPGVADCGGRLVATLEQALERLRRSYGSDMGDWKWGRAHVARFANPVLDQVPLVGDLLRVAIPASGGSDTVNRGPSTITDDSDPFAERFGAGLRIITDLAMPEDARMMIVPGQSGNPLSRHYANLLRPWRDFAWLVPGRSPAAAALTLVPAR